MTRKQEITKEIVDLAFPLGVVEEFLGRLSITVLLNVRDHLKATQGS